ncbi:MAG: sigma-70 family RNA polymerase sigma factor [Sedimentisphaerales bacterium]|nr:sigma-70 family RNA polymerase sigma factor [Sedimentisphaerales bacterium]
MNSLSQAEEYLLQQVRRGSPDGWSQLVNRYQGRLLAFAQSKLKRRSDAEDIVQETFIGFLKGLDRFRGEASLETYLFTILRRKIVDSYRSGKARDVCLLQDVYDSRRSEDRDSDPFQKIAGDDPTASTYLRRDEQLDRQRHALADALLELANGYKQSLNFRDLQIVELLFYAQFGNRDVAQVVDISEKAVAVIKHRCLKQVREHIQRLKFSDIVRHEQFESLLTQVWESLRPSCPKRSTIGAFLLETLDDAWQQYVHFHLHTLGCHFCRANLEDLQKQTRSDDTVKLRNRIMESTVGFLRS